MRLIWTDEGRPRARAHGLREQVAMLLTAAMRHALPLLVVIACGDGNGSAGDTEGTTGGMPTSTEATDTMSGGPGGPTTQTSTPASDSTSTAGDSTGEASTGEPGTSATEASGTTGTPETGSSGSSDGGSSSTGETGTTGGIMSQDCADGCVVEFQCGIQWQSAEECTEFCNANLAAAAEFSPFCMQAWEALSACLGTLDCDEFNQWQAAAMFPYPCHQEDDALAFECDGQ